MYQALYRKWRPKTFDEVIGQEHITETLKTQVQTQHLSHAYLFIGTRGTGKTTCARILAKAVNCEKPVNGNPCNKCRYCRGIDDGSILDIVELDAASNTGVDNVRDLKEEAVFTPAAARKRVYIIDEVHMLSLAAFNALLKIIEEPPPHLMFILATTELQKVPATILSRCQRHSFRRIPTEKLAAYLESIAGRESFELEKEAALQIGRLAEGGVRDALSILDQCSVSGHVTVDTVFETMGLAGNRNMAELFSQVLQHNAGQTLLLFQKIWLEGKEPSSFLGELSGLLRDLLALKALPGGAGELLSGNYERQVLETLAGRMTQEELLFCLDTVQNSVARMRQVRNPRTEAELCLSVLCENRSAESVLSLRARISRLEETVRNGIPVGPPAGESKPLYVPETDYEAAEYEPLSEKTEDARPEKPPEPPADEPCVFSAEPAPQAESGSVLPAEPQEKNGEPAATPDPAGAEKGIIALAKQRLPMELRFSVDDPAKMRLRLSGQELILEALPGFLLDRLRKPEVRSVFSEAAAEVLGHSVNVRPEELRQGERPKRSLEELRQFKEVRFV
ncbi:MAG: DNA polymerase III subunit gamma/tau [Oscillospiraceae bacterium]|nr:DNA polymerase III subunit gamma/tau [Oscillospiraceae bacterium]